MGDYGKGGQVHPLLPCGEEGGEEVGGS